MNTPKYSTFETEFRVRPDDIDMYKHVHVSKYIDYVLAARYDQMDRCYGMSMEKFFDRGFGWLVRGVSVDYKRPLLMSDYFIVSTGIDTIEERKCRVKFSIRNKTTNKISCDGWFDFALIDLQTAKGVTIPRDIIKHYTALVDKG
jgi:YbgC/YbaW family acyl-CoA thioester hydrolase